MRNSDNLLSLTNCETNVMIKTFSLDVILSDGKKIKYRNLSRVAFYRLWNFYQDNENDIEDCYSPSHETLFLRYNQLHNLGFHRVSSFTKPPTNFM